MNRIDLERLLNIDYSDEEWAQLLDGYDDQLDKIRIVRQLNHPNSAQPALTFDPRLPGITYDTEGSGYNPTEESSSALPDNDEDIAFAPAWRLAHWIREKQISSIELTELYLSRIQRFNTKLECFITVTAELARSQAQQADTEINSGHYRGPLHGLPYGLKDLFDTVSIPTTWGAEPYKDRISDTDARIVRKLREAGAVLIGKTSCGALAYGDIWHGGVTRNPWDLREGSSGSSAGSASATAAGLVAFSIGTETLGSIISPSVRCGTTGLRPTFGRVGRSGGMALCWSLDKIGPICRSVDDTAIVLQAINGHDPADASSIPTRFDNKQSKALSDIVVGYDPQFFSDDSQHLLNRRALQSLENRGVALKEISLPTSNHQPLGLQLEVEAAAAFEALTLSDRDDELRWQVDRAWPNTWRKARLISAIDYLQVDRLRRNFMQEMHDLFQSVDVVIGDNFGEGMLKISNFTGHPQLTLPIGFQNRPIRPAFEESAVSEGETGEFPHSIGLWGPLFGEGPMLTVGNAIEEQVKVNTRRPTMA